MADRTDDSSEDDSVVLPGSIQRDTEEETVRTVLHGPRTDSKRRIQIVTVHGLAGSLSMRSLSEGLSREYMVQEDVRSSTYNFDYDPTTLFKTNNGVSGMMNVAAKLLSEIAQRSYWRDDVDSEPLVILAHDVGGLVAQQAILLAQDDVRYQGIYLDVQKLVLFAVPCADSDAEYDLSITNLVCGLSSPTQRHAFSRLSVQELAHAFEMVTTRFRPTWDNYHVLTVYEDLGNLNEDEAQPVLQRNDVVIGARKERVIGRHRSHWSLPDIQHPDNLLDLVYKFTHDIVQIRPLDGYRSTHLQLVSHGFGRFFMSNDFGDNRSAVSIATATIEHEKFQQWRDTDASAVLSISGLRYVNSASFCGILSRSSNLDSARDQSITAYFSCHGLYDVDVVYECFCKELCAQILQSRPRAIKLVHDILGKLPKDIGTVDQSHATLSHLITCLKILFLSGVFARLTLVINDFDLCPPPTRARMMETIDALRISPIMLKLLLVSNVEIQQYPKSFTDHYRVQLDSYAASEQMRDMLQHILRSGIDCDQAMQKRCQKLLDDLPGLKIRKAFDANLKVSKVLLQSAIPPLSITSLHTENELCSKPAMVLGQLWQQLSKPGQKWALEVLMWLVHSCRVFGFNELAVALSIAGNGEESIAAEKITQTQATIKIILSPIVLIQNQKVLFTHPDLIQSAKEQISRYHTTFLEGTDCHSWILRRCLNFLSTRRIRSAWFALRRRSSQVLEESAEFQFTLYATRYWHVHYSKIRKRSADDVEFAANKLADPRWRSEWFDLYLELVPKDLNFKVSKPTEADLAIYLGLEDILRANLSRRSESEEAVRRQLMMLAIKHNRATLLEQLLEQGGFTSDNLTADVLMAASSRRAGKSLTVLLDRIQDQDLDGIKESLINKLIKNLISNNEVAYLKRFSSKFAGAIQDGKIKYDEREAQYEAIRFGHIDVLKTFLQFANLQKWTSDDQTQHLAIMQRHTIINEDIVGLKVLSDSFVNIHPCDKLGRNGLHWACMLGNRRVLEYLTEQGNAQLDAIDIGQRRPIHYAALYGHAGIVRWLLSRETVHSPEDKEGATPVDLAIMQGHTETVRLLLKCGAQPAQATIHTAIDSNSAELVKLICEERDELELLDSDGLTPFLHTVRSGSIEIAEYLIRRQCKTQARGDDGLSALLWISSGHNPTMCKAVLNWGGDVKDTDEFGLTPLHRAAVAGDQDTVKLLIDAQSDSERLCRRGRTALHYAAEAGSTSVTALLLAHGTNKNAYDKDQKTPLDCAISQGRFETVLQILRQSVALVPDGMNANEMLRDAAKAGSLDTVRYLRTAGAIISNENEEAAKITLTLLQKSRMEIVEILLDQAWNLSPGSMTSWLLVLVTIRKGLDTKYLLKLLKKGADINQNAYSSEDNIDGASLHFAVRAHSVKYVRFLLERGADIECRTKRAETPLALSVENVDIAKILLDHHADPKATNRVSGSVMNTACMKEPYRKQKPTQIFNLLLDAGVNLETADEQGRTAFHVAASHNNVALIEYFLSLAPEGLSWKDNQGRLPLHCAAALGSDDMVDFMLAAMRIDSFAGDMIIDFDGWSVLHWACRGRDRSHVLTKLLEKGADPLLESDEKWTAKHVALFHGKLKEYEQVLKGFSTPRKQTGTQDNVVAANRRVTWDEERHSDFASDSSEEEGSQSEEEEDLFNSLGLPVRQTQYLRRYCDICFCDVYGVGYACEECHDFDLCFKCYKWKSEIHPEGHTFNSFRSAYTNAQRVQRERRSSAASRRWKRRLYRSKISISL